MKYSKQRELILQTVTQNPIHPTADAVYEQVRRENPKISLGTVYRNLNFLSELGILRKIPMPVGSDRFDGRLDEHYHMICDCCGRVFDVECDSLQEMDRQIMLRQGFRLKEGGKNFEAIQPRYVFRLNVEGKTEDELMAGFHQKWRYNIRLAQRKGVEVRICGKEMVPDFARLMLETGVRDGFVTRQPEYFSNMLDNLGEHCRLYMAFYEGEPIAGTLAIHYGDKVWYLYGASSNEHRNLMPNYLLQWRMIQWAVETGCRIYDFRGVSGDLSEDNPLYGLYKFKKGFGGDFTEFVGEMDLVLNRPVYFAVEHGTNLLKEVRKRAYLHKNRQ